MLTHSKLKALHAAAFAATLLVALPVSVISPAAERDEGPRVFIVSPLSGETIHDNTGAISVTVAVKGDDQTKPRTLRVLLDCTPPGSTQRPGSFTLQGVERGTHVLEAHLVDRAGNILAKSTPLTFHMWQASALFPGRKTTP
jgi:hypothetical protein